MLSVAPKANFWRAEIFGFSVGETQGYPARPNGRTPIKEHWLVRCRGNRHAGGGKAIQLQAAMELYTYLHRFAR